MKEKCEKTIKLSPEYINLIKLAKDKSSWRNRLSAVKTLSKHKCYIAKEILWEIAINDKITIVRKHAYYTLKQWGEQINFVDIGKPYKSAQIKKVFSRVKKKLKKVNLNQEDFKIMLKQIEPELYDVLEYENRLDKVVENELEVH